MGIFFEGFSYCKKFNLVQVKCNQGNLYRLKQFHLESDLWLCNKIKNLEFLGKNFQTQTKDGWPNPSNKNLTWPDAGQKNFDPDSSLVLQPISNGDAVWLFTDNYSLREVKRVYHVRTRGESDPDIYQSFGANQFQNIL